MKQSELKDSEYFKNAKNRLIVSEIKKVFEAYNFNPETMQRSRRKVNRKYR